MEGPPSLVHEQIFVPALPEIRVKAQPCHNAMLQVLFTVHSLLAVNQNASSREQSSMK